MKYLSTKKIITLSLILFSGSKLNFKVPVNIVGSYGMTVILFLNSSNGTSWISIPSMTILPSKISTILDIDKQIVLFPAPVLPTIPIFSPGLTLNDNFLSTVWIIFR